MTLRRLVRLVPIGWCAIVGCTETLAPHPRLGAPPRFGDFLMSVDSVIVTPNPVARGDSVTVVLRGGQASDCMSWALWKLYQTTVEARIEPWGIRGSWSACHPLQDYPMRLPAPEAAAVDSFTVTVSQPGNRALRVRVGLTGPDPRLARPRARPKRPLARPSRPPAGDSAATARIAS